MAKEDAAVGESFDAWVSRVAPKEIARRGSLRHAFEYGACAEFGGKDFGHIYTRADCLRAEMLGREMARNKIASGEAVTCDKCQQAFSVFSSSRLADALEATVRHVQVPAVRRDREWHAHGEAILQLAIAALREVGRLP